MYCYVDESGNTGLELFDANQPKLHYGVLTSKSNLDVTAEPLLQKLRSRLGVKRLHANELGVGGLTQIAPDLIRFSRKNDLRFSFMSVNKSDHAVICFFDQVFDSVMNKAVRWMDYFTPLRYVLVFKVAALFDDELRKKAWRARRETNSARSAEMLVELCKVLLERIDRLPDPRSREVVSGALRWAAENPFEIEYGVGNKDTALQISPNLIGFQQVLQIISLTAKAQNRKVQKVTVDRQNQFNTAQGELAEHYQKLRGHTNNLGPGMPSMDLSMMPEVPPSFVAGDESAGLELVDVTLWTAKRLFSEKPLSPELKALFWSQARRGKTDEVSLEALENRWRHLAFLPEPTSPLPEQMAEAIAKQEEDRKLAVSSLSS